MSIATRQTRRRRRARIQQAETVSCFDPPCLYEGVNELGTDTEFEKDYCKHASYVSNSVSVPNSFTPSMRIIRFRGGVSYGTRQSFTTIYISDFRSSAS